MTRQRFRSCRGFYLLIYSQYHDNIYIQVYTYVNGLDVSIAYICPLRLVRQVNDVGSNHDGAQFLFLYCKLNADVLVSVVVVGWCDGAG